jgi:predicted  nucleic acid-binding Zn-ribbon protein
MIPKGQSDRLRQELNQLQQSARMLKDQAERLDERCRQLQTRIESENRRPPKTAESSAQRTVHVLTGR